MTVRPFDHRVVLVIDLPPGPSIYTLSFLTWSHARRQHIEQHPLCKVIPTLPTCSPATVD